VGGEEDEEEAEIMVRREEKVGGCGGPGGLFLCSLYYGSLRYVREGPIEHCKYGEQQLL